MQMYSGQSAYKAFTPVHYPFWHLERDSFWHLHIEGDRQKITSTPTTKALKRLVRYASFDDDLWTLLQDKGAREQLRSFIISNKLQRHSSPQ
jgi:putative restriction endonuclease